MIIPCIDLMNGKAVQLDNSRSKALERDDVLELATELRKYGPLSIIDIDAAMGRGDNSKLIKKLCSIAECRVGGGIRTIEKAKEFIAAGAAKIIIGSAATPDLLKQLPREMVIVALDIKNNKVVLNARTQSIGKTVDQVISELEPYCSEFFLTNADAEGKMKGCDFENVIEIAKKTSNRISVAGGIATLEEIRQLEERNISPCIGRAFYTNKLNFADAFISVLKFDSSGLIPTIAQDENNQVIMLAYSSAESLKQTFQTGLATYYSRSRKKLWAKGETSGNTQDFITACYDCDRDALLFTVRQKNAGCHNGTYSCFGGKRFALKEVYETLADRLFNPQPESYTSRIGRSEESIKAKIIEEANEVVNYTDRKNLVLELADLAYFTMLLMAKKGISLEEVKNELKTRNKTPKQPRTSITTA